MIFKNKIKFVFILLLIIFDSFIISINFISFKKDITTPGGLNEVRNVIEIESDNDILGSFNTLYVYSYDKASVLRTFVASLSEYNSISDSSTTSNLSYSEQILAGKIQKNQSIECSLICAYNYAKRINPDITLEYEFAGFLVSYRQLNQTSLEIGDLIYYVKRDNKIYDIHDPNNFVNLLNDLHVGDEIGLIRNEKEHTYLIDNEISTNNLNRFSCYAKYYLDNETAKPSYTLHKSNTLGPSGGLLQTLSIYCQITGIDLTRGMKICGTGTISARGNVGAIGGVSQKIVTALRADADVFICPEANSKEGLETYLKEKGNSKMKFIIVSTFEEAVTKLGEINENQDIY